MLADGNGAGASEPLLGSIWNVARVLSSPIATYKNAFPGEMQALRGTLRPSFPLRLGRPVEALNWKALTPSVTVLPVVELRTYAHGDGPAGPGGGDGEGAGAGEGEEGEGAGAGAGLAGKPSRVPPDPPPQAASMDAAPNAPVEIMRRSRARRLDLEEGKGI